MKPISLIRSGLLLAAFFLASGLGQPEARSEPDAPLQFALRTDQATYSTDQAVRMTLTLTNPSNIDVILSFRSSQQADFVITRNKEEIWRWSDGRMFAQVLTQMKLGPNEQREIHAIWDQKDGKGRGVPVGTYEAVGLILVRDRRDRAVISFRIVSPPELDHGPTQ